MFPETKTATLEERMAMAAQSQAASAEHAAALVQHLSEIGAAHVFCGKADVELLASFTEEIWDDPRVDVDTYRGFCPFFQALIEADNENPIPSRPEDADPYKPMWGVRCNNALVLLGEMMLDHAKGRRHDRDVYHCLHQTLGQYLNALEGPAFRRGVFEAERFQLWKDNLLRDQDPSQSMADALAGILRRYMAAWETCRRLDHALTCLAGLALHLETIGSRFALEPAQDGISQMILHVARTPNGQAAWNLRSALRRYGIGRDRSDLPKTDLECEDPWTHFLQLAHACDCGLPDPGEDMEVRSLRTQIFLPYWAYGLEALQNLTVQCPYPDFKAFLEETFPEDALTQAMKGINGAVLDLYMLFVEPFLHMETAAR